MACLAVVLGLASCAQTDALVARDTSEPRFETSEDAGDGATDGRRLCPSAICPFPWGSCDTGFPCSTDLSRDKQNCGACGNVCPSFEPLFMRGYCVDGGCVLVCFNPDEGFGTHQFEQRDCNGAVDDGCESNILSDERNCGVCGLVCPEGVSCIEGHCGCPSPNSECNGKCVDLSDDSKHCGTCERACVPPDGCMPPHAGSRCSGGACQPLECAWSWEDCNHDLERGCESDGCEADLDSVQNCGGCGVVCPTGTACQQDENGVRKCRPKRPDDPGCSDFGGDVLSDIYNCGGCGLVCPVRRAHEEVTCEKGICVKRCIPGFGDCDGDATNGCEVDLFIDPNHCGACGNVCDGVQGQACIEGKCLMGDCPLER